LCQEADQRTSFPLDRSPFLFGTLLLFESLTTAAALINEKASSGRGPKLS